MFYTLTWHALVRMQQRGKTAEDIKMILRYGTQSDGSRRFLRNKDADQQIARRRAWIKRINRHQSHGRRVIKIIARRISALERMRNCTLIFKNEQVITVYNNTRRRRWWRR